MERKKEYINAEVYYAYQDEPFTLEQIQAHALPGDEIHTGHVDPKEDLEPDEPEFFLTVVRERLETDEEFAERCRKLDEFRRESIIRSHHVYLNSAVRLYGELLRKERCPLCGKDAIVQDGEREGRKVKPIPVFRCEACDTEYFREF